MTDRAHRPRSGEEWRPFNAAVIDEYRTTGSTPERFAGLRLMVLHTIGARSGKLREIPLFIVEHESGLLVYGTAEGAPNHPGWVHNLRANPEIVVEFEGRTFDARFDELPEPEATAIVGAHAETTPMLATYVASAAPRAIPVFRIQLSPTGTP